MTVKLSEKWPPIGDYAKQYDYTFHYRKRRVTLPFWQTYEDAFYGDTPNPCEFLGWATSVARDRNPRELVQRVGEGLRKLFDSSYDPIMDADDPREAAESWCRGTREL